MILALYKQLKEIALAEFGDIVMGAEVIVSHTGRARKLRMTLIDDTFVDVWHSQEGEGEVRRGPAGFLSAEKLPVPLPPSRFLEEP